MAQRFQILRAALLDLAGLALGLYVLAGCWSALQAGEIVLPLGRRLGNLVFTAIRAEQPLKFFLGLMSGFLFGTLCALLALWNARMVFTKSRAARHAIARDTLDPLEKAAPSGLAPLWWGLLVAIPLFLLYAATRS